jgi:hypothetical protein
MNDGHKRRRIRFSLSTLLLVFAALSIWLGFGFSQLRQRDQIVGRITMLNGKVLYGTPGKPWNSLPLTWKVLRVRTVNEIALPTGNGTGISRDDTATIMKWFPEAYVRYYDPDDPEEVDSRWNKPRDNQ